LAAGIDTTRVSIGDQAALYIRRLIFDGALRPGTRVPQDEIAQALGVSRIPVREALIGLEREGWVTIELHRGAFVNALDAQSVRDHYGLYGLVYGFAARRALARSGGEDVVAALEQLVKGLRKDTPPEEFTRVTLEFHRMVVHAAQSTRIKVVLRAMSGIVPGDFFSLVPDAMAIERRALTAITQAMRQGDQVRVDDEYVRMMEQVGEAVVELFNRRRLFHSPDEDGGQGSAQAGNGRSGH